MSTQELSRSTLESKDKEQLATIAKAMGGKPTTRTKKDDLVDMILGMAGVDADGKSLDTAEAGDEGDDDTDAQGKDQDDDGDRGAQGKDQDDDDEEKDDDADDKGRDTEGRDTEGRDTEGRDTEGKAKGGKGRKGSDGQQGGSAEERKADVEPGNRRRRRRGRGREKDRDDEWFGDPTAAEGHLDLREEGYAFLRVNDGRPSKLDVYVPVKLIRQFNLRRGDHVTGMSRPAARSEKNPAMMQIDTVNGAPVDENAARPDFDDLTPTFPTERIVLERKDSVAGRALDLLTPLGKGARGLVTAPPRSGKTAVLREVVKSIEANHPEVTLMVLLIEERPEEVTEMVNWLEQAEVVTSAFDRPAEEHIAVAELLIDRAKRRVELGDDVVIVTDGLTRLARAYNSLTSEFISSDAVSPLALAPVKRFLGAARCLEEGGSLTIIGTALVDTGVRTDDVIFGQLVGTETMEIRLDKLAAQKRIWPAIDVEGSSTLREELLFDKAELKKVQKLRQVLAGKNKADNPQGGLEHLLGLIDSAASNSALLGKVK